MIELFHKHSPIERARHQITALPPPARVLAFLPSPGASPRGVPSRSPSPLPPVPTADLPGDGPRARGVRLPRGAQRLPRPLSGPDPGGRPRRPDPREHGRGRRAHDRAMVLDVPRVDPPRARRGRRRPPLLPPAGGDGDGDARARLRLRLRRRGGGGGGVVVRAGRAADPLVGRRGPSRGRAHDARVRARAGQAAAGARQDQGLKAVAEDAELLEEDERREREGRRQAGLRWGRGEGAKVSVRERRAATRRVTGGTPRRGRGGEGR